MNSTMTNRLNALKERGFDYAAIYLEDPIVYQDLTVQDVVVLNDSQLRVDTYGYVPKETRIRGIRYVKEELEEMLLGSIPDMLSQLLLRRNITRGIKAEEIYIIKDIYEHQEKETPSDRFDGTFIKDTEHLPIGSRVAEPFKYQFTREREFIGLLTGAYLFAPHPERPRVRLLLTDVLTELSKKRRTPELDEYVKDILRKTHRIRKELSPHYYLVNRSEEVANAKGDEQITAIKKLQERAGFNLQGYTPIKEEPRIGSYTMWSKYAQMIKDGIIDMEYFEYDVCHNAPSSEFRNWILDQMRETFGLHKTK